MKCRLCDRPTAGTVKLCADCTKAMMRARGASAAQYKPPKARPNRIEFSTATKAALPAAAWSPGWTRIAWATAGLAAIGTFYVSQVEPDRRPASVAVVADRPSIPLAERPGGDATLATSSFEAPSPTAEANAADGAIARATAPRASEPNAAKAGVSGASTAVPAGAKTSAKAGTTAALVRRDSRSSPPVPTPTIDPAADKSRAPAPADGEASQLLARASGQPASPLDADQVSASTPDTCGTERGLARFVCEQKVYMQYCENKWDKDPRCMRRTGSN